MPPSAPQFRALCKDTQLAPAHRPFPKALPKPPPNIHKGKAALSVIKHNLRKNPGPSTQGKYSAPTERIAADEAAFGRQADYEKRKAEGITKLPIKILQLPTYAPWTNPIEKLWRWVRQTVIHLHGLSDDWDTLKQRVCDFILSFRRGSNELLRYVGLLPV